MARTKLTRRELVEASGCRRGGRRTAAAQPALQKAFGFAGPLKYRGRRLKNDLSILQWVHFVPAYDKWLDSTYIKAWGEKNDREVKIDHINNTELPARAAAEVAAQSGHDCSCSSTRAPTSRTRSSTTTDIVQEVDAQDGKIDELGRSIDLQPEDEEVARLLGQLRPRPGRLAPRPVERRRRVAGDVGSRAARRRRS